MDDVTFTDFDDEIDFDDGDEAETSKAKPKKKATRKKAAKSSSRKSTKAAGKATKTTRRKASAAKTEASVEDDGTGFGDDTDEADERPARKPAKKTARKTTARKSTRKKSTSEYDGEAPAEVVEAFSAEELEAELARRKAARNGDAGTASSRDDDIDFDDDEPAPKAERKRSVRSRKAPRDEFDFDDDSDDNSNDDSNANADEDTADKSSASSRSRGGRRGRRSETTSQDETDLNSDTISNDQTGDTTGDQADDDTFGDDADASGSRSRSRRSRRGDRDGSRESSSRDRVDASDDDIDFDDPDDGESSGGRSSRIRSGSGSRSSDKRDGQRDDQRDDRRDDNRPARSRSDQDDGDQPRRRRRRRGRRGRGGDGDTQTREGGSQQGGHNSSTQRGQNDRDQGSRSKRGRRGRGGKKPQGGGGYSGQPHVSGDYSDASGACDGVLEMHPKGYGFLRSKENDFAAQEPDPFVSTQFIEKYCLREGVFITGELGPGHRNQGPRVREIETIEGMPAEDYCDVQDFDKLTPVNPFEQIKLETGPSPVTMRIVDLLAPIGKGQRALIVAPPRSGKTILLQQIADSVAHNHPECHLMVLLIDERPEEVTEMRRHVKGEVIASTLDNNLENHVRVSQLVVERAKRLAERGEDVFLLLDSITRTARAFNKYSNNGPTGSGGMGVRAMEIPKKLFGTARRFDEGGSVTVVGTALIETGGRIDDVIFQEFKGTGNMELVLSRDLADRRIFPAIDISKTGTRREELLLDPEVLEGVNLMRRSLLSLHPVEAMEQLIRTLAKFNTNDEFLEKIRSVM